MATTIKKPDSLHTYLPMEYDFVPYDRLCFAYSNIGEYKKADEMNDIALRANPSGHDKNRCVYNKLYLERILNQKKDGQGTTRLNLGCGGKKIDGYIDVDIIETPHTDEVFPMNKIPYTDGSIEAIYSEHSLEHLSHNESREAIQEFGRVMKSGGELKLFIPDFEECCRKYVTSLNNELINGIPSRDWYRYTIYGYQQNANDVTGDQQYHKTGFSKNEIVNLLEDSGFVIDYCENY